MTRWFVSGSDRAGEADWKIFEHIRGLPRRGTADKKEQVLVVGRESHFAGWGLRSITAERDIRIVKPVSTLQALGRRLRYQDMNLRVVYDQIKENFPEGTDMNRIVDDFNFLLSMASTKFTTQAGILAVPFTRLWRNYTYFKYHYYPNEFLYDPDRPGYVQWQLLQQILRTSLYVLQPYLSIDERRDYTDKMRIELIMEKYLKDNPPVYEETLLVGKSVETFLMIAGKAVISTQNLREDRDKAIEELKIRALRAPEFYQRLKEILPPSSFSEFENDLNFLEYRRANHLPISGLAERALNDEEFCRSFVCEYIRAAVWYTELSKGNVIKHNYIYPYSSGPHIFNFLQLESLTVPSFEPDEPLSPMQYILSTVTAHSKRFLPEAFQHLFNEGSKVHHLYFGKDKWERPKIPQYIAMIGEETKKIEDESTYEKFNQPTLLFMHGKEPNMEVQIPPPPPGKRRRMQPLEKELAHDVLCLRESKAGIRGEGAYSAFTQPSSLMVKKQSYHTFARGKLGERVGMRRAQKMAPLMKILRRSLRL